MNNRNHEVTTEDPRRAEARRLRADPGLSIGQLMKHFGVGSATLTEWLRGIEPPEWTRRPNAKDDLRAEAVELRKQGWSVNDLAVRLGVAKSTAYLWVKHIPLDQDSERAAEAGARRADAGRSLGGPSRRARPAGGRGPRRGRR